MARNITYEPCTLVYTLLDEEQLCFDDFYLIVRSLHSFMVESIVPNIEHKNVHVKLGYQASIANAQNKLGTLKNVIAISKLSNYIKDCEFSRLERLRQQFGLLTDEPVPMPKQRGRPPRGGRGVFGQRPAPYPKKPRASTSTATDEYYNYEDAQRLTPLANEAYENPEFAVEDITRDEQ